MRPFLLTGFEPFNNRSVNPSQQIAEALDGEMIAGVKIVGLTLPVVYGEDTRRVLPALTSLNPIAILSFGLDAGARGVNVEMFAINHRLPATPSDGLIPIDPDGPAAYFATIDTERVAQAIRERVGIHAMPHGYAGSYLCNHVFYQTLRHAASHQLDCRVGFLHVPPTAEDSDAPATPPAPSIAELIQAARIAVDEVIGQCREMREVAAATSTPFEQLR